MLAAAARIATAVNVPVTVDAEAGYGMEPRETMSRARGAWGIALGLICCVLLAELWAVRAAPRTTKPEEFIVHEWGTFSTFSGSDGELRKFAPDDRDLPTFVHSYWEYTKGGLSEVLVSLETPVVYFHSKRERTISVHVDFPEGQMTQWYPQTSRPPLSNRLVWEDIQVLPQDRSPELPIANKGRYYAAREGDACSVRVKGHMEKTEAEKFLFYRGVGSCRMPLSVRAEGGGVFRLKNTGKQTLPACILVRVEGGKVWYQQHDSLAARTEATVREPAESSTEESLAATMAHLLVRQGLYEKEARAMLKTWRQDWFGEDGTRVLYLVPAALTEEVLPLHIQPKPDQLVRVLVGRHDVLTPERERHIDTLFQKMVDGSKEEAKAADRELNKLGRHRQAAITASRGARLKTATR
jgi:hypothetical protein